MLPLGNGLPRCRAGVSGFPGLRLLAAHWCKWVGGAGNGRLALLDRLLLSSDTTPDDLETARRLVVDGAVRRHSRHWRRVGNALAAWAASAGTTVLALDDAVHPPGGLDHSPFSDRDHRVGSILRMAERPR